MTSDVLVRQARPDDLALLVAVLDAWWGGRSTSGLLHRFFFEHFAGTCFVAEDDARQRVGFLVGFLSQTRPDEAYIRLIAVHPGFRGAGIGRALYQRFFKAARAADRSVVRAVTSPENRTSVAFHTGLGFVIGPGDGVAEDGLPITPNYDGRGGARVRFIKRLND